MADRPDLSSESIIGVSPDQITASGNAPISSPMMGGSGSKPMSIDKLAQIFVRAIDNLERATKGYQKTVSNLGEDMQKTFVRTHEEAAKAQDKNMGEGMKKFEQMSRAIKRQADVIVGGVIWGVIVQGIFKAIKAITQAMEFNLFGWIEDRIKNVSRMLTENIGGMNDALQSFRAGQEAGVQWQQSYGMSSTVSQSLQQYAATRADAYRTRDEIISAYSALQDAGLRGEERIMEFGDDAVIIGRTLGISIQQAAQHMYQFREVLNYSREDYLALTETAMRFQQGLATAGISSPSNEILMGNLNARSATLSRWEQSNMMSRNQGVEFSLMSDVVSRQAGLEDNFVFDFLSKGMTVDSSVASLMQFSPEELQEQIKNGNMIGALETITGGLTSALNGQNQEAVIRQLETVFGLTAEQIMTLTNSLEGPDMRNALEIFRLAVDREVGQGVTETFEEAITPLTRIKNEITAFATHLQIGGVSLLDMAATFQEMEPYINTLTGGINFLQQGLDATFGPLSPIIKGPLTMMATIVGIGAATSDLTDTQRAALGPLAAYADLAKRMVDRFLPDVQRIFDGVMTYIKDIFNNDNGPSVFEEMFNKGALWLGEHGVEYANIVFDAISDILDEVGASLDGTDLNGSPLGRFVGTLVRGIVKVFAGGVGIVMPIVREFLTAIKDALANPEMASLIEEAMNTLIGVAKDTISFLWEDLFKPVIVPLIGNILSVIGQALASSDNSLLQGVGNELTSAGMALSIGAEGGLKDISAEELGIMLSQQISNGDITVAQAMAIRDEWGRLNSITTAGDILHDVGNVLWNPISAVDVLTGGGNASERQRNASSGMDFITDAITQGVTVLQINTLQGRGGSGATELSPYASLYSSGSTGFTARDNGLSSANSIVQQLMSHQIQAESGGQNTGANFAGASGYAQFTQDTWNSTINQHPELGLTAGRSPSSYTQEEQMLVYNTHMTDLVQNYLSQGFDADSSAIFALAAYNAGEGRVTDFLKGRVRYLNDGMGNRMFPTTGEGFLNWLQYASEQHLRDNPDVAALEPWQRANSAFSDSAYWVHETGPYIQRILGGMGGGVFTDSESQVAESSYWSSRYGNSGGLNLGGDTATAAVSRLGAGTMRNFEVNIPTPTASTKTPMEELQATVETLSQAVKNHVDATDRVVAVLEDVTHRDDTLKFIEGLGA